MDGNSSHKSIPAARFSSTRWQLLVCIACLGIASVYGCQMLGEREIASPLSYSDQQEKIMQIAPKGTSRDMAVTKLSAAGIAGEFSRGESTYYCGSWRQENGDIWRTNVALLFDESGEVIGTRPIESSFGLDSSSSSIKKQSAIKRGTVAPVTLPVTENSARNGPRRPFED